MRKLLLFISVVSFSFASAQSFHLGVFGGLSNYQGDLTDKIYQKNTTKGAFGITGTYELTKRLNLRGGLAFASVAGNDKWNTETAQLRNLNFSSKITELSLLAEFNVFNLESIRWTPYAFGGLAVYRFNPYTFDSGGYKTFLQPLSTEGQGLEGYTTKPYSLTQLALPFGGGIKYGITDNIRLGLEVGMRKLFTDHLDDVSTTYADAAELLAAKGAKAVELAYRGDETATGNPAYPAKGAQRGGAAQKDWYYFSGLHLAFRLNNNSSSGKKGFGCPATF